MNALQLEHATVSDLLDKIEEEIATLAKSHADALNCIDAENDDARSEIDEASNAGSNISTNVEWIRKKLNKVSEELG